MNRKYGTKLDGIYHVENNVVYDVFLGSSILADASEYYCYIGSKQFEVDPRKLVGYTYIRKHYPEYLV